MASPTYHTRALVLRRTKLGESDVIVTLLNQDGSQLRAVAKGARKPTSPFSSRLELFCVCDLLLVQGKSLDIVKEARLIEGFAPIRGNLDLVAAGSPMLELLARTTDPESPTSNLFDMTVVALASLTGQGSDMPLAILAAHLLKAVALLGFRPSLSACISCDTDLTGFLRSGYVDFSYVDGGVVCPVCSSNLDTVKLPSGVVESARALMFGTFEEICYYELSKSEAFDVLRLFQSWAYAQFQFKLKSLEFVFASYGV